MWFCRDCPVGCFLRSVVSDVLCVQHSHGVEHCQHHYTHIREDGGPHACKAQSTQNQAGKLDAKGKSNVLIYYAQTAAGNFYCFYKLLRLIIHQHDVCGLNCGVGAQCAHGDANVGAGDDGSIVDAVAHEAELAMAAEGDNEALQLFHLAVGQKGTLLTPATLLKLSSRSLR